MLNGIIDITTSLTAIYTGNSIAKYIACPLRIDGEQRDFCRKRTGTMDSHLLVVLPAWVLLKDLLWRVWGPLSRKQRWILDASGSYASTTASHIGHVKKSTHDAKSLQPTLTTSLYDMDGHKRHLIHFSSILLLREVYAHDLFSPTACTQMFTFLGFKVARPEGIYSGYRLRADYTAYWLGSGGNTCMANTISATPRRLVGGCL